MSGPPIEHQWYLAKYIADDLRQETRNIGVVLRAANDKGLPRVKLLDPVPFLRPEHLEEWRGWVAYWGTKVWAEHGGQKPFYWIGKPSQHAPHIRWELAGSRLVSAVDFDQMFELLVKPENR